MTLDRRAVLLSLAATGAAHAAHVPAPPRIAAIYWPGQDGQTLHGTMAIPARAHGRQAAVLVLGEGTAPDPIARYAIEQLAAAGLVACAPNRTADGSAREAAEALADARATLRWLGTNRYSTGQVGVIGLGRGAAAVARLVEERDPPVAVAVLIGDNPPSLAGSSSVPTMAITRIVAGRVSPPAEEATIVHDSYDPADAVAAARAFDRAFVFLKEHLRQPRS